MALVDTIIIDVKGLVASSLACAIVLTDCTTPAWAKVIECAPVVEGDVEFISYGKVLEAVDRKSGNTLWTTVLFTETFIREYDPKLEEDVQLNVACVRRISGRNVVVTDRKQRTFYVDKVSGKIVSPK